MSIGKRSQSDHGEEMVELENHFILRLPRDHARKLNEYLRQGASALRDKLQISFQPDMRNASVMLDSCLFKAKLVDLPNIIETLKTVDRKNCYKVADISQMLVCEEITENDSPASNSKSGEEKDDRADKKKEKQYQWPHGITPPLKNVRKRRFRRTLRKKYMDAPEVDKELKRLLRADLEAAKVRWELVSADEEMKQKLEKERGPGTPSVGVLTPAPDNQETSEKSISFREDEIFGDTVSLSSGSEDEEVAEGRQLAHQLMKSVDENSNSADSMASMKPPLSPVEPSRAEIQHIQSDLIEHEKQLQIYQNQLATLENPILKARLQAEIEKHLKKEKELKQQLKTLKQEAQEK